MAAKVVMVAVPTVLGIASIRVYTVSEAPADGLVSREKLNIYTPVVQLAQTEFVPEQPGVIQTGLAAARQTIQPYVQAAQSACSSVKRGSVRLYHTGEDVFFYLKDPPPEFLPRFGTITMAGLLGMFLARKGSHFRRVALPLGLMGAGASVCYPAQAVGVLKVTGKKVSAAGQWSSAVVSSLFASKPQQPAAKDPAPSSGPLQETPVPNLEFAVPKETSEAESVPGSAQLSPAEPAPPAAQGSSAPAAAELSPIQASIDSVEGAASAITAPEETFAVDTREDISAAASPVESPPVESPPVESPPVESPLVESPPVESPLVESPLVDSPPPESPPPESPPAESPLVESPLVESPPAESPPAESPPVESPLVESPLVESPPAESPPAGSPLVESPPSESPLVESESPHVEAEVEAASVEEVTNQPSVPVVESAEPLPESGDPTPVAAAAADETPTTAPTSATPPPPPSEQPTAESSKGGTGFKADPALMDFGQSSAEDEDLYSTRS